MHDIILSRFRHGMVDSSCLSFYPGLLFLEGFSKSHSLDLFELGDESVMFDPRTITINGRIKHYHGRDIPALQGYQDWDPTQDHFRLCKIEIVKSDRNHRGRLERMEKEGKYRSHGWNSLLDDSEDVLNFFSRQNEGVGRSEMIGGRRKEIEWDEERIGYLESRDVRTRRIKKR
ncbi:hypothetical protein Tco_0567460 [Tanacetum coccineum]